MQIKIKHKCKEIFVQPSSERPVKKRERETTRFEQREGYSRLPDQHGQINLPTENDSEQCILDFTYFRKYNQSCIACYR